MTALPSFFAQYQALVDAELLRMLPEDSEPVSQGMAYTVLAPSKRIRPVLTLLSAELCGGAAAADLAAATCVELVHAFSLILDDLPSMDDAPRRRGRPANHVQFGEPIAILEAFGLLSRAYATLALTYEPALAVRLVALLGDAVGTDG
jgi:geranylgeranyl diphosphate synthase, type II